MLSIWLACSLSFLVPLLYLKGQRTALILRDVSAATLECKESNCCPKFGVCVSVRLCVLVCLCTYTHFCVWERDRDYRWHWNCSNQGKLVADLFTGRGCRWLMAARLADVHRLKGEGRVADQPWEAENCGNNLRLSLNNAARRAPIWDAGIISHMSPPVATCLRHAWTRGRRSEILFLRMIWHNLNLSNQGAGSALALTHPQPQC